MACGMTISGSFPLSDQQAATSCLVTGSQFQGLTQAGLPAEGIGDHTAHPEPRRQIAGIACQDLLQQCLRLGKLSIFGHRDGPPQELVKCGRTVIDRSLHGSP